MGAALAAVVAIAWAYLWQGAGMGMSAIDMTVLGLFPHRLPDMPGEMDAGWLTVAAMWWVMMIAMMTPGAVPLVLLYRVVLRRHPPAGASAAALSTFLLAGYLAAWLAFSLAAATVQKILQPAGLLSDMMLWSRSAPLSAAILATAGLYQLSPLKHACLSQCRSPVRFLTAHWRAGRMGSFLLGARHGAYCVGCCGFLMCLLFVGGVMNLVWIALLSLAVLAEKLLPAGEAIGKASGLLLVAWAAATLMV